MIAHTTARARLRAKLRAKHTAGVFDEMLIDNFAGGGGASLGMEWAIGRAVDVAINHNHYAVSMHRANHSHTLHLCQDVFAVDPIEVAGGVGGRRVGLAWFSPDCTYHSKARGGKPIRDDKTKRRDLAWVVIRWAALVRPRIIMLENVEEFAHWGPLTKEGRPCKKRKGKTFRSWTGELRKLGYDVQWRELKACDFGSPTIRKRLFLVARCDGQPIVWPKPTHGPQGMGLKPYRTAAECIDWDVPICSIFATRLEAKAWAEVHGMHTPKRPLADNTLKRIAAGIKRYVIDAAEPFIVSTNHGDSGGRRAYPLDEPLRTACASSMSEALVVPFVSKYHGQKGDESRCRPFDEPINTLDTQNRFALVAAFMARHYGGMVARDLNVPHPTTTTRGTQNQLVAVNLLNQKGTKQSARDVREPLSTICASTTHAGLVAALLVKYYGCDVHGQSVGEPLHTIPTRERFGLVTVHIHGEPYIITDIGMRMLQPRELFRAQGFPDSYRIDHGLDEHGRSVKLTKTEQVRLCGNSVCRHVVEALVRANMTANVNTPAAETLCTLGASA